MSCTRGFELWVLNALDVLSEAKRQKIILDFQQRIECFIFKGKSIVVTKFFNTSLYF